MKCLAVDETKSWSRCTEMLGMVSLVGKERGDSRGGIGGIIISKFYDGK